MKKRFKLLDFLRDRDMCERDLYWIRKLWYVILIISLSLYILCDFQEFVTRSLISHFDGNSLLFILWVILLLLPLIESVEGYGFKVTKERQSSEIRSLTNDVISREETPTYDDLTQKYNETKKEPHDE